MALTVVGLGPGPLDLMTVRARDRLWNAHDLYLQTRDHPVIAHLPQSLQLHDFDAVSQRSLSREDAENTISQKLLDLAQGAEGVLYAVPGHPLIGNTFVPGLLKRGQASGISIEIIAGVSLVDTALDALASDAHEQWSPDAHLGLQLLEPLHPAIEPGRPALVALILGQQMVLQLKKDLLKLYPTEHEVIVLPVAQADDGTKIARVPLANLEAMVQRDEAFSLYIPPLPLEQNVASFEGLCAIVARLRAPNGCPWDREQTHASLKPYIIEEAYETLEALDLGDLSALREELGDLLLNILLHCQIGYEAGEFDTTEVIRAIAEKLIRRHPHVFGDLKLATPQEVKDNWEALKGKERAARRSMLDGLPTTLPALAYTRSLQERITPLKLPTNSASGPLTEMRSDAQSEIGATEVLEQLGQALFALATQATSEGKDPEEALRLANGRFRRRLRRLEELAWERGKSLQELSQIQRTELWKTTLESQG